VDDYHFTNQQWQGGSLEPIKVDNFVVVPPWEFIDIDEGKIRIVLDPGVVFGNGLHPTTRDCLRALASAKRHMPFNKVLDLGTGTGILALAAALLGAETVFAVDINPLCVKTAIENTRLNGLEKVIQAVNAHAEDFVDEIADLVVANIHHEVINSLLDCGNFCNFDQIIISGLMRSQFRDVKIQLERKRFQILREWDHDMTWFTCLAKKKNG
jgi:ribosomal protein L11 methyltransferase